MKAGGADTQVCHLTLLVPTLLVLYCRRDARSVTGYGEISVMIFMMRDANAIAPKKQGFELGGQFFLVFNFWPCLLLVFVDADGAHR